MGHVIRPGIPGAHDRSWRTREGYASEVQRRKAVRARREEAKVAARRRMIQARRDAEIELRRAEQARKEAEEEAKRRQAVRPHARLAPSAPCLTPVPCLPPQERLSSVKDSRLRELAALEEDQAEGATPVTVYLLLWTGQWSTLHTERRTLMWGASAPGQSLSCATTDSHRPYPPQRRRW